MRGVETRSPRDAVGAALAQGLIPDDPARFAARTGNATFIIAVTIQ